MNKWQWIEKLEKRSISMEKSIDSLVASYVKCALYTVTIQFNEINEN